jgi:hypothetical protein
MRALAFLPSVLLLTACGAASPTWMPAGYSYHNDVYKAQPGPEADTLGYDYTPARNEYMEEMWAGIADTLILDLETKTGMAPQAVYLEKLPGSNAFNLSLDNALREKLRERGYTLAAAPGNDVVIKYQAFKVGDENKRVETKYNGDVDELNKPWNPEQPEKFTFVLTLVRNNAAFGEIRRTEILPAYGYVEGEGNILPAPRVMEGKVQ